MPLRFTPALRRARAFLGAFALLAAGCGSGAAEPANLLPAADPGPDTVGRVFAGIDGVDGLLEVTRQRLHVRHERRVRRLTGGRRKLAPATGESTA